MSFFFGVYPAEKKLSRLFDLARLIAQPDYARKAHITLRGPYDKRPSPRSRWLRQEISDATITRPSTFFNDHQNTVFLGLFFLELSEVSWKPDFREAVPHMTMYDGNDRSFAWQIFQILRDYPWRFKIELTPVQILEKKKEYDTAFFLELDDIDLAFSYISERPMRRAYIKSMHVGQRIYLLNRIFTEIHQLKNPSSAH